MSFFRWLSARWQGLFVIAVFVLATVSLTQVTVGDVEAPFVWPEAIYHAMAMFVVSSPGFPRDGHTTWMVICWLCHFLAPLATASVLAESIQRLKLAFSGPSAAVSRLRDHAILCGFGNHGRALAEFLIERAPSVGLVIVDRDPELPDFVNIHGCEIPVVRGDLSADALGLLETAGLHRAEQIFFATGDDLLNLSVCATAQAETEAKLQLLALIGDERLTKGADRYFSDNGIRLIDPYRASAEWLLRHATLEGLTGGFDPAERDIMVVGCGRFGAMVVHTAAQLWSVDRRPWIVVVDLEAETRLTTHPTLAALPGDAVVAIEGDARHKDVVERALDACTAPGEPLVLLCTDDDLGNFATAVHLREHLEGDVNVLMRLYSEPAHEFGAMLKAKGIRCFGLREFFSRSLHQRIAHQPD